jgi:hypothetical protein
MIEEAPEEQLLLAEVDILEGVLGRSGVEGSSWMQQMPMAG